MEYSILVKRVVNVRIDGIRAPSQRAAIGRAETLPFYRFINSGRGDEVDTNPDGSPITLRYIDDGEETNCYLVDEAEDEEFERSEWYASDGVTNLNPGRVCGECMRPRDGRVRRLLDFGRPGGSTTDIIAASNRSPSRPDRARPSKSRTGRVDLPCSRRIVMGSMSAMSSIDRVLERHGDQIREELLQDLSQQTKGLVVDIQLGNNVHEITVSAILSNGTSLELSSMNIDFLAEEYPDCENRLLALSRKPFRRHRRVKPHHTIHYTKPAACRGLFCAHIQNSFALEA